MGEENFIKFLGTGGARFVVARQLRRSAGVWYELNGVKILMDPGPGSLVTLAKSRPHLDPVTLNAILLTHRHIDHSNDINILIEAMTDGGKKKHGRVFAPIDCLENDPVILRYIRSFPEEIQILEEEKEYAVDSGLLFRTSIRHDHPVETYGIHFLLPEGQISHMIDTAYFDDLLDDYRDAKILILHVVRYEDRGDRARGIYHLNLDNAREIISAIRPRLAILTHFGMTMLQKKPWILAQQLSDETGVEVKAASDGLTLNVEEYLKSEKIMN